MNLYVTIVEYILKLVMYEGFDLCCLWIVFCTCICVWERARVVNELYVKLLFIVQCELYIFQRNPV
jgi:hypothetical protein